MNLQVIKKRVIKVFAYTVTSVLFLIISAFLFLQMPPVQKWLISHYLKDLTEVTGYPASVESFKMLWFDRLELSGVRLGDPEGNTMIRANEILINFELHKLLSSRDINIDGVYVDSAHVYITMIQENDSSRNLNINTFIARINENYAGSGGGKPPRINIGEAFLNQSQFSYINQDRDSIRRGFNFNQFSVAVDEAQLNGFSVIGDTTEFHLNTLIAKDIASGFPVNEMSTFFRISQGGMEFLGLNLRAGESIVQDTIVFHYERQRDLNDFVNRVVIQANLANSILNPLDLALFAPEAARLTKPLHVSGAFNGRINKFKVTDMDVLLGNTRLSGTLDMDGLPEINETFIILNVKDSQLDTRDLSFLLNPGIISRLEPMGMLHVDGQFLGYPTDFVANGTLIGKLGTIRSDINFKVNETDFNLSEYSGRLSLASFSLGRFLGDTTSFQQVAMDGQISGSGLTQQTADFRLNGQVTRVGIKGYDYSNISTDARFAAGLFSGFIRINDPNLEFEANGSVDLRDGQNHIQISATLDTAYFHNLRLSRDEIFLHSTFTADVKGLTLDSLQGHAEFKDIAIDYKGKSLRLDSINIVADRTGTDRELSIQSSIADANITGDYLFSSLIRDVQVLIKEIGLNIRNDSRATAAHYAQKNYHAQSYEAGVDVRIKDIEPVAHLLNLDLTITPETKVLGRFTSGYTTIFNCYTHIDSLSYKGMWFIGNDVEVTASKIADSTAVLAMATINSESQTLTRKLHTKNLLAEGIWSRNHIDFGLDADQEAQSNKIRLTGNVDFVSDSTIISMDRSMVNLLEREWHFGPGNYIALNPDDVRFNNVSLISGDQSLSVNGALSDDPARIVTLEIDQLDLSIFNVLTSKKIKGTMDATVDMSNYYRNPTIQNAIDIRGFTIDDFLIGDIAGSNRWDTTGRRFNIDMLVTRDNHDLVKLEGRYTPTEKRSPLDVDAILRNADLKILEPFLEDIFPTILGTVSGNFRISGKLDRPEIQGEGNIADGQITVGYLKTSYRFTGIIGLTPRSIFFRDIDLVDAFRNTAQLNGTITHDNFNSMHIDLTSNFRNFQVLNTSIRDNELFYGQAYASGTVQFFGPVSNLRISSTARTEKNTRIYIPISGSSSVEKKDFITFINFGESTSGQPGKKEVRRSKIRTTGITFDLNLDVTPDAYCEIIFDLKAGDIIRGRGNGDLRLAMDTKGEFNMFGAFEFTEGWYNFTLYDIINKEFEIQKGSKISWYGDPYQGVLDINASYNQQASLAPLLTDLVSTNEQELNIPQLRRKYPVQVLVKIEGLMLSSNISFDIIANDLPKSIQVQSEGGTRSYNLDIIFTAFKNRIDEQELKRQVFSLIVLRRFSPPEAFNTSGSVVNSVSELLSNQLSYWMSQVDQNLVIDVDLGVMDEEAFNTFQLRFSYTFAGGRLRVTGDGTFNNNNNTPGASQANPSSIAGDWTVDYMLTADGKLRVKMYSRTNVNPVLSSVNNQNTITTGASIIHTQSFNEIKDLWRRSRNRKPAPASESYPEEDEVPAKEEEDKETEQENKEEKDPDISREALKKDNEVAN